MVDDDDDDPSAKAVPSTSTTTSTVDVIPHFILLASFIMAVLIHYVFKATARRDGRFNEEVRLGGGYVLGSSSSVGGDVTTTTTSGNSDANDRIAHHHKEKEGELVDDAPSLIRRLLRRKNDSSDSEQQQQSIHARVNRNYDKLLVSSNKKAREDDAARGVSEKFKRDGGDREEQGGGLDNIKESEEEVMSKSVSKEGLMTSNKSTAKDDSDKSSPINTKATSTNQQQLLSSQPQQQQPTLLQQYRSSPLISSSSSSSIPVELKSQTNHPGLAGYYNWKNTVTSLYRIYAIPSYSYDDDDDDAAAAAEPQKRMDDNHQTQQTTSTSRTTSTTTNTNIAPSFIIYLSLTSSPTTSRIPLHLRSHSGSSCISVSELRRQVSEVTCVPLDLIRLVFGGKIIQEKTNSNTTGGGIDVIAEYGLVDGCVIHVVGKPSSTPQPSTPQSSAAAAAAAAAALTSSNSISRDNNNGDVQSSDRVDWVFDDNTTATTNARRRKQYHPAVLPMHPSSERGKVPVYIEVTNHTTQHETINVYWVDYTGNEIYKGSFRSGGGSFRQTTYIGHPWTFRVGPGEEGVLLKYVPFRVVPSIVGDHSRIEEEEGEITMEGGIHRFELHDVPEMMTNSNANNDSAGRRSRPVCWVEDKVLPESPLHVSSSKTAASLLSADMINNAIQWSCQQIRREDVIRHGNGIASAKVLLQYLKNIQLHPDKPKYRQLRVSNRTFQHTVYDTGARGVLLALGFEELYGYMECGPNTVLGPDRVRQVCDAIVIVNETLQIMESGIDSNLVQPEGVDGYGRAGFGHADGMNN